ncbi:FecR family protein [Salisaeta longa]|uniref:FecR family protein n=1 Tax=Salisaeta longa TaxID=503170 RepID=UPI0003B65BF4|nr:FecR domain-containing protein [Salisaeta longa]
MPESPEPLPPDDRHRALAARIGHVLDAQGTLDDAPPALADDPLIDALAAYRAVRQQDREVAPDASGRMWQGIQEKIGDDAARARRADRPPQPRRQPPMGVRWWGAIAATVAVLIGVVWWTVLRPPAPTLLAAAQQSIVTYQTAGGATVRLRPHSRLYRVDATDAPRFRLAGEAHFQVPPQQGAPFTVVTDRAKVQVVGTAFTVRTWAPAPTVYVSEGRVRLSSRTTAAAATIAPGERGSLVAEDSVAVTQAAAAPYMGWLQQTLTFTSRPAGDVAREMEQHFNIAVQMPDTVATQRLTGRIMLTERSRALREFGLVLGGQFVRTAPRTYRWEARSAPGAVAP